MKTLTSLIAAAAISIAATGVATADESVADAQVRAALSEQVIHGQAQPAATQLNATESGMSAAANRVEQSLNADTIKGEQTHAVSRGQSLSNDNGKSVAASRFEDALNDNA
ncbi:MULTISPECIES: hypothetical protein [unclassified Cobetia]|uniref:hypothetical protein n=1 Tax=unclassified Cobetia TaxID=2609414 RepID=UPI001C04E9D5|nr:hypothetical protein [Cobetia sp. 4B]MBR9753194.1 hypothetical protein [Gammaproteobacteria bacterium]QWN37959.1 hypothetical protein H2O77_05735 [Cobetia sp. 4B]|tara:strand:- start:138 stop:470 length:333 start_codon:yes stop_codon:yes gene_type:complete